MLEDVIVHARGWDDAVLQVEQQGRASASPGPSREAARVEGGQSGAALHFLLREMRPGGALLKPQSIALERYSAGISNRHRSIGTATSCRT